MNGRLLAGIMLVTLVSPAAAAVVEEPSPEFIFVRSNCGGQSNDTVAVPDSLDIRRDGAAVDSINCSEMDAYQYPRFSDVRGGVGTTYRFDTGTYLLVLLFGALTTVAAAGVHRMRGGQQMRQYIGPLAVYPALMAVTPILGSVSGGGILDAVLFGVAGLPLLAGAIHLYRRRDLERNQLLILGGLYVLAAAAAVVAVGTSATLLGYTTTH